MDKDFYTNDFEGLLKDKTEEFKMYPSESVWTNVYNKLHPGRKWGIIGGSVLLLLFTASVLVLRTNNNTIVAKKQSNPGKSSQPELLENKSNHPEVVYTSSSNQAGNNKNISLHKSTTDNITLNNSADLILNKDLNIISSNSHKVTDLDNNSNITVFDSKNKFTTVSIQKSTEESNNYSFGDYMPDLSIAVSTNHTKAPVPPAVNVYINANAFTRSVNKVSAKKGSRFEWQLYFAPSVSYRALFNDDNPANIAYAYSNYIPGDIDKAVSHSPAMGFELGNAVLFSLTKSIKFKAGLQLNYSRYNIKAYSTTPELATIRLNGGYNQTQEFQVASSYKSYGVYYQATTIGSQNVAISVPLGVDIKMIGNKKVSWYVAGSFQPTYILNNKSYLITNDLKNYVNNSDLFRKFTMNTGLESFLRFERNNGVALQIGPQIRYQLNSSYTTKYPISEHLIEYGLKVGITKKF